MKQAEISGDTRGGRRCRGLKGGEATGLIFCKMVFRLFFFLKHAVTFNIVAFGKSNQEGWRRRRKKKREGGRGRKEGRDRWREDGK